MLVYYVRVFKTRQNGCTALARAGENGHADCMRLLLEAGDDENSSDDVRCCVCVFLTPSETSKCDV
jgi:hypothetical protein